GRGEGRRVRPPEARAAGPAGRASERRAGAEPARRADAERGGEGRGTCALSRALRPDRSLGEAWWRQGRDARGGEDVVRASDGDADGAEPDPGLLPARADEEERRRRQQGTA